MDRRVDNKRGRRWNGREADEIKERRSRGFRVLVGSDTIDELMSKKTKKRKLRARRNKANHGKRPNAGRG